MVRRRVAPIQASSQIVLAHLSGGLPKIIADKDKQACNILDSITVWRSATCADPGTEFDPAWNSPSIGGGCEPTIVHRKDPLANTEMGHQVPSQGLSKPPSNI